MAGHGGGAWKVAYADFVTAMMAFFLVMWIVAQNKPVKEAVARYFNDPYGTSTKPGRSSVLVPDPNGSNPPGGKSKGPKGVPNPDPTARLITDTDPADATSKKPSLLALHTGRDAYVGTVIAFDETSAELSVQAKRRLKDLVPDLLGKPNKIELRGHTSGRRLPKNSPFADPWQLSYARSQATMRFLAEQGVELRRFRLSQSAGFEPKSIGLGAEAQAQNARVEIYMLGELADDLVGTRDERDNRLKNPQNKPRAPQQEKGGKE